MKQNWSLHHYKKPSVDQDVSMHRTVVTLSLSTQERQVSSSEKDTYHTSVTDLGNNFKSVEKYQNIPENNVENNSYNKNKDSYNKDLLEELNSCNNDNNSYNKEENYYNSELNSYNKDDYSYNSYQSSYNKESEDGSSNSVNGEDIDTKLWDIAALAREKNGFRLIRWSILFLNYAKKNRSCLKSLLIY